MLLIYFQQVQHLQKVLVKKRDPVTHVCFIDELAKVSFDLDLTLTVKDEFNCANKFFKTSFGQRNCPKCI